MGKKQITILTTIMMAVCTHYSNAIADKIYLKNGKIIDSQTVWIENSLVKYKKYGTIIGINKDKIIKILRESHTEKPDAGASVQRFNNVHGLKPETIKKANELYEKLFKTDKEWRRVRLSRVQRKDWKVFIESRARHRNRIVNTIGYKIERKGKSEAEAASEVVAIERRLQEKREFNRLLWGGKPRLAQ